MNKIRSESPVVYDRGDNKLKNVYVDTATNHHNAHNCSIHSVLGNIIESSKDNHRRMIRLQ